MMQKKKGFGCLKRIIAGMLALCLVIPDFVAPSVQAEAAEMNYITPEQQKGDIKNKGFLLTSYEYFDNGDLVLTNKYNYVENITQTYHTVNTIWSKNKTGTEGVGTYCHPTESGEKGVDWVYSNVRAVDIESSAIKNTTKSTYTYTNANIQKMLTTLYGELQPDTDYVVYISEIFCLKTRKYKADGSIDIEGSIIKNPPAYDTIEGIRGAAKWTAKTSAQFEAYYDIPMTFRLAGGNLNVVCVDMDTYNMELTRESMKLVVGKGKRVDQNAKITVGGATYTYQGVYNVSETETCTLDTTGGNPTVSVTAGQTKTVYFGYKKDKTQKQAQLKVVCVDKNNTSKQLRTSSVSAQVGGFAGYSVADTISHGGKAYKYANVFGVVDGHGGSCVLSQSGRPDGVTMDKDAKTLYLGYELTDEPAPSDTPTPSPTPVPTIPAYDDGWPYTIYERYYTTSNGYTLDVIANQKTSSRYDSSKFSEYKAAQSNVGMYMVTAQALKDAPAVKRTESYLRGRDSSGNEWNFIADNTNLEAKEVHPYKYDGKLVSEKVGEITSLVFPSTITYNGKTYKVVSIGGGSETYHKNENSNYSHGGFGQTITKYGSISGSYFNAHCITVGDVTWSCDDSINYWYGVLGNGAIETFAKVEKDGGRYRESRFYNYYVYNTTLKEITIPDSVTEILPYAFCYCQKLETVNGGKNVAKIGDYAFMGVQTVDAAIDETNTLISSAYTENYKYMNTQKSKSYRSNGYNCREEYYYNESNTFNDTLTQKMKDWKSQILLGNDWTFPEVSQVPNLATIGYRAFAFHSNLKDVTLSSKVASVGVECFGYDKLVDIYVKNNSMGIGNHYQTLGTHGFYTPTDERTLVYAEAVSTAAEYVTKYTNWYKMNGKKEIELDGWQPDIHTDTVVEVEDGKKSRDVVPPEKYDYVFDGYYTEPNGGGKKYFDEDGKCIKEWEEPESTKKLYAYWKPTQPPTYTPYTPVSNPAAPETYHVLIQKEGAKVQIYADDYDSTTGALTDKQPYLTDDLYSGAVKVADGAIPSTEDVAVRGKTGAWMYDISLEKVTGNVYTSVKVTVPYKLQYQDTDGTKKFAEGSYEFTFNVPKSYSYWKVVEVVTYKPTSLLVNNSALKGGTVTLPVDWSAGSPTIPTPVITSSAAKTAAPNATCTATTAYEGTYASYGDIDFNAVKEQCKNLASAYQTLVGNPTAKSDKLVIDGVTVLDNTTDYTGNGKSPSTSAAYLIQNKIPFTDYTQTYKSGIELNEFSANANYASLIQFTYDSTDGTKHQYVRSGDSEVTVNDVKVHTPVVCDGIISVGGEESGRYADGNFFYGAEVDFPIRNLYNAFTVDVSNYGMHRLLLGYGERDFTTAKSGDVNIVESQNAVKFNFPVYYDVMNNSFGADGTVDFTDDKYFPANTWINIGTTTPTFYVLGSITTGKYTVDFRSVAVNCPKDASGNYIYSYDEKNANRNVGKYVAYDRMYLNIHEDFMDFEVTGTNDPRALEEYNSGKRMLTLDKGYFFSFRTSTIGKLFQGATMQVEITPSYTFISADGKIRTDVDLYYSESIKGKSEYYVKVGNVKDQSNIHSYTNRDDIVGISEALLQNTVTVSGDSTLAGKKTDLFSFGGKITSDSILRMYPKMESKLPNMYCGECYVTYCSTDARPCAHTSTAKKIFDINSNEVKKLIQQWYGGLYIPADTYAITRDTKVGSCATCGRLRYVTEGRTTCPDHGTVLTGLTDFNFANYAASNTITGDEEFFRKDGYIAINFQIKAVDTASTYERAFTEYDETEIAKQWKASKVPYRTGDVILYRLDKSIRDAYEIGGSE